MYSPGWTNQPVPALVLEPGNKFSSWDVARKCMILKLGQYVHQFDAMISVPQRLRVWTRAVYRQDRAVLQSFSTPCYQNKTVSIPEMQNAVTATLVTCASFGAM